jgi:hypothetical protein
MDVTRERRTDARLADVTLLLGHVLEGFGDGVTIIGRRGEPFLLLLRRLPSRATGEARG